LRPVSAISVSLVIPTYNERPNLQPLVEELFTIFANHPDLDVEIIVVDDDSPDGTASVAKDLEKHYPLRLLQRTGKLGLGSAVMAGFSESTRDHLAVLDADLSHDPAVLPHMIRLLADYDVVIGSRFGATSRVERWTPGRKLLSLAGVALARKLTGVEDPLSGYFCLRRRALAPLQGRLVSSGYKILFEILARGRVRSHASVDYVFRQRRYSASKLNLREYILFIRQLLVFGIMKLSLDRRASKVPAVAKWQRDSVIPVRRKSRSEPGLSAIGGES